MECHNTAAEPLLGLAAWLDPASTRLRISADGGTWSCPTGVKAAVALGDVAPGSSVTLYLRRKFPQAPRSPFVLSTFFACATVAWGTLCNTWFGTHPALMNNAASLWLNHPN